MAVKKAAGRRRSRAPVRGLNHQDRPEDALPFVTELVANGRKQRPEAIMVVEFPGDGRALWSVFGGVDSRDLAWLVVRLQGYLAEL